MPSPRSTTAAVGLLVAAALAPLASAWNMDVHQQIGFLAEQFLTKRTSSVLAQILEPEYNGSIGNAAAWADEYAHTKEGAFSYQWHWIDSADNPPSYCNVYYHRDCSPGGCVVSAIANQTSILRSCLSSFTISSPPTTPTTTTNLTCSHALKWLTHFIGDIAQPLHASGVAAGGNGIRVVYARQNVTLHSVWDGHILYSAANTTSPFPNATGLAPFFADRLLPRILADAFPDAPRAGWLATECADAPAACALAWARDSNAWTCDYVFARDMGATAAVDLATSGYAEGAFPIVELQVSKAAVRLAAWLNALVDGVYGDERAIVVQTARS
ncbi:nuclease pa3 [Diplodia corticola]|uniref:Nuclease pa3 n=1 Tax=Diplodia corticola TaxID=236234 RepID=A0A1J9S765_9PEZI|nr:nuclease pa3 [Diplodia corticola]OJD35445.1 nuclease pa3 [Diplodia corticola]